MSAGIQFISWTDYEWKLSCLRDIISFFSKIVSNSVIKPYFLDYLLAIEKKFCIWVRFCVYISFCPCRWVHLASVKDSVGQTKFKYLPSIMLSILSISVSQAEAERQFSVAGKNWKDERSQMGHELLEALLILKATGSRVPCYNREFSPQELRRLKSACYNALKSQEWWHRQLKFVILDLIFVYILGRSLFFKDQILFSGLYVWILYYICMYICLISLKCLKKNLPHLSQIFCIWIDILLILG